MLALAPQIKKMTPAERAAQLIATGKPKVGEDSDDDEEDDENESFGIVSTNKLKKAAPETTS